MMCRFNIVRRLALGLLTAGLGLLANPVWAGDDLLIFSDQLNNGWQNWGWVPNYTTNNPTHSGTNAIGIAPSGAYQALHLEHDRLDTSLYTNLVMWVNGGATGGQSIQVGGLLNGVEQPRVTVAKLPTNSWQQVTLSLAALGCANQTNFNGIQIWGSQGSVQPGFFADDISLVAQPPAPLLHVGVNAAAAGRTVDARVFGLNAAAWDGVLDTTNTTGVLGEMNTRMLRWPGGSWGDQYHWTNEPWMDGATSARNWGSFSPNFIHVATNTGAQVTIICNYGTSTPQEAAFGVRMFNVTNHCAFKYWEVGNENYGSWEADSNTNAPWLPHDPWTYAMRFTNYYAQMKAVDPTIKIGAVLCPDESSCSNNATHFAVNPRTGTTNYGWAPIVLATLKSLGVTPDFVIEHKYAPNDGDSCNLLWTQTWKSDAASLRQMLSDYLGTATATNVELVDTEFGPEGEKQWVSLVGGLYYADSVGQVLQTEFNELLWWALRNGVAVITNSDNALYGWRTNSQGYFISNAGCVNGLAVPPDRYPGFYCMKLMTNFARGGDTVVLATNDYERLGTYAVKRTNGTLTLLVINKSSVSNLTAAVSIAGFRPATNAAVYNYGMPQDDAARTGIGSVDVVTTNFTGAGISFTNTFAPYSATVLAFTPLPGPVANPDPEAMGENLTNTFSPLTNDLVSAPGGRLALVSVSATNGGAAISGTNVMFTPTRNFLGAAAIGYVITDNQGGTNQSVITVTVTNVPPVANSDTVAVGENTTGTLSPLTNDLVLTPGGSLALVSVSPTNGAAAISGTNILFTPATNFLGTATIGYAVTDGLGGTNQSLITVNVTIAGATVAVLTFTNSTTWICPAGVTSVQVDCWGGGGGGGGSGVTASGTAGAGGGGGGAFAAATVTVSATNSPYAITVGGGGAGGAMSTAGTGAPGGASWFGLAGTMTNVYAGGGAGGVNANGSAGNGGAGGAGRGATNYSGGAGGNGGGNAGGGGGSAGGAGGGGNGAITSGGAAGAAGNGLAGGAAGGNGASAAGPGSPGNFPGGGAGGAKANTTTAGTGGTGAGGELVLAYAVPLTTGTNLAFQVTGRQLTLQWPASYIGWLLQSNSLNLLNTNDWFTVPGFAATNQAVINLDATQRAVFFRLARP